MFMKEKENETELNNYEIVVQYRISKRNNDILNMIHLKCEISLHDMLLTSQCFDSIMTTIKYNLALDVGFRKITFRSNL